MSVLTNSQIKSVAKFLKTSCDTVHLNSSSPKLGQWLDILSEEFGYKDWNVTCAKNRDEPELVSTQNNFPVSHSGFLGLARVVSGDAPPTHHLCYAENREWSRFDLAVKLAQKMRSQLASESLRGAVSYTRPDVMAAGQHELNWKSRSEGSPIVIKSNAQDTTILLWWLWASFLQNDPIPVWMGKDTKRNFVQFSEEGGHQLHDYAENELNDSLTDVFLETLTGRAQPRRSCWYVPRWPDSSMTPTMLLVEEGNPNTRQVAQQLNAESWDEIRAAAEARNEQLGLSKLDCEAIFARYEAAQRARAEEPAVDFSGVYDD